MYKKVQLSNIDEYFERLSARKDKGVYFYRLCSYGAKTKAFLVRYIEQAKKNGVVIEGKIPNPDGRQLAYYEEMMGNSFAMNPGFFGEAMKKWMPAMDTVQRTDIVNAMYDTLFAMQKAGKNENMLKNAYIKFMCWMYYRFARITNQLGRDELPKIILQGEVSGYELKMLGIIACAGCDILLVETAGDEAYAKVDHRNYDSFLYNSSETEKFPSGFSIMHLEKEVEKKQQLATLFDEGQVSICATNIWLTGNVLSDALKKPEERGNESRCIYNMFCRITGVDDKATFSGQLFKWKTDLESHGRKVYVLEEMAPPTPDEVAKVNTGNIGSFEQLLVLMTSRIKTCAGLSVENQMRKALVDLLTEENQKTGGNLNRVKNKAVYILCWLNRYDRSIFQNFKNGMMPVLVYFGVCHTQFEAFFLRFMAKLPLDVILINTNLSKVCCLEDDTIFDQKNDLSMDLDKFPVNAGDISYGTVAYHAEQDLTEIMYQDSGLYRNKQYQKAEIISLQTMYEEVYILWDQEVKYRPNFDTLDNKVVLPTIVAKVSGVKDGNQQAYWQDVKKLVVEDTIVVSHVPYIYAGSIPGAQSAPQYLKNRKLLRNKIKSASDYKYGIYREETQEYIFDKIEELLDSGLIKGTYSQGMEFKIISVALNLDTSITRLIQKIDFTKKIPKLLMVAAGESQCSAEDAIMMAFLHFIGFDVVLFAPTGYQIVEQHFTQPFLVEHQIGDYVYDMVVPPLEAGSNSTQHEGLMNKLFRRR